MARETNMEVIIHARERRRADIVRCAANAAVKILELPRRRQMLSDIATIIAKEFEVMAQ